MAKRALLLVPMAILVLAAGHGLAEPGGKNLQVLPRTTSRLEIKKIMKSMSDSLGVKCDYCHKEEDMAFDTPHKATARDMMKMVGGINTTYFKGQQKVTCLTCHQGKAHPPRP